MKTRKQTPLSDLLTYQVTVQWALPNRGWLKIHSQLTHCGSDPVHPVDLGRTASELIEAQGRRQRWECVVLEQGATFQALSPQILEVLVEELDGLAVGSDALVLVPEALQR